MYCARTTLFVQPIQTQQRMGTNRYRPSCSLYIDWMRAYLTYIRVTLIGLHVDMDMYSSHR